MAHLEDESLIENRTEVLALDFGLKFFLLVRQHVDFNVGVRSPAHVHGCQVLSLQDAYYQLRRRKKKIK